MQESVGEEFMCAALCYCCQLQAACALCEVHDQQPALIRKERKVFQVYLCCSVFK